MDIKAPTLDRYRELTRSDTDPHSICASIALIMESGLDHEFRTTAVKALLSEDDLKEIVRLIRGAKRYVLQPFGCADPLVDPAFESGTGYSAGELEEIKGRLGGVVGEILVR